ncbi:MAG TPA: hypothetical protein VK946_05560 [Methylotenera sp.]|nr:hypothetical protein [Methylotenera sp.]
MFKHFSHIFVYLLLALMPLQSMAAANMLICNSMMQAETSKQALHTMPCHEHMTSPAASIDQSTEDDHPSASKTNCTALCSNLCGMVALQIDIKSALLPVSTLLISTTHPAYASITLPSLQRPPIFLA